MTAGVAEAGTSGDCSELWAKAGNVAVCGEVCVELLVEDVCEEEDRWMEFSKARVVRELDEEDDKGS